MRQDLKSMHLWAVLGAAVGLACGAPPEEKGPGSEQVLSTQEQALCSGLVDGTLTTGEERLGVTGAWSYSQLGVSCGVHSVEVIAYPMVIDSNGNRTTCFTLSKSLFQNVSQACPGVSGGSNHTMEVKADGSVWTWGSNSYGQLGSGNRASRNTPQRVRGLSNVIAVSAGLYHSVALKEDGTVWTWGYNWAGQLGDGTTTRRLTPVTLTNFMQ